MVFIISGEKVCMRISAISSPYIIPKNPIRRVDTNRQNSYCNNSVQTPTINFTGIPIKNLYIKFLENRCVKHAILGSKRPYLPLDNDLAEITKPIKLKVGKKEKINGFDINPNNSDKYVIFLHGFSQNITNNQPLYRQLAKSKFGILTIDYRGYGKNRASKNTSENNIMEDIQSAVNYLKAKGVKRIGLIGHSFGGYLAAKTSSVNNYDFQILVSPVTSMEFWKNNVMKHPKKYPIEMALIRYLPKFKAQYAKIYSIDKYIQNNPTPTYVIHSKNDRYISSRSIRRFIDIINNNKRVLMLQSGGHSMQEIKIKKISDILDNEL